MGGGEQKHSWHSFQPSELLFIGRKMGVTLVTHHGGSHCPEPCLTERLTKQKLTYKVELSRLCLVSNKLFNPADFAQCYLLLSSF